MWKKQKGPRPTSQHMITKNLAIMQKEVRETVARIIKARKAFRLPKAKSATPIPWLGGSL
jgi:hypothetical protein